MPVWEVYEKLKEMGVGFDPRELVNDIKIMKDYAKETEEVVREKILCLISRGLGLDI